MMSQIICQFTFIIVNQELSEPNSVSSSSWVFQIRLNALIFHVTAISDNPYDSLNTSQYVCNPRSLILRFFLIFLIILSNIS